MFPEIISCMSLIVFMLGLHLLRGETLTKLSFLSFFLSLNPLHPPFLLCFKSVCYEIEAEMLFLVACEVYCVLHLMTWP